MAIRIRYETIDRFRETRRFQTLTGARAYARRRLGDTFDISDTFHYAIAGDGVGKITVVGTDLYTLLGVTRPDPTDRADGL